MRHPSSSVAEEASSQQPINLDFSRILNGDKRKNPFSKLISSSYDCSMSSKEIEINFIK